MTLGDTPKISFSQKCRKSLRIYNYGFCFRKWRSMTLPNGPGFCFQKWRSVRYPDFWLFSTLTFNIVTWWRHTCDVTSCTYTLTDTLSATYDVTVLSPCVTSQVTKIYFWILFPWMTLGDVPKIRFYGSGFCFQKWRSVTFPEFGLCQTSDLSISQWWRHTRDVIPCTHTLTDIQDWF